MNKKNLSLLGHFTLQETFKTINSNYISILQIPPNNLLISKISNFTCNRKYFKLLAILLYTCLQIIA